MNLVTENLMLVIDPVSHDSAAAAQLWLKNRLADSPDKKPGQERLKTNSSGLTKCETISLKAQTSIVDITLRAVDQEPTSESDSVSAVKASNEDLCEALEMQLEYITNIKNEALATQDTLHPLYTAYELGTTVFKFIAYISLTKQVGYNTKDEANIKTREAAERLIHAVIEKSTAVKKGLDESGWIDKVLESVLRGAQTGEDEPKALANTLKSMIDEVFLEEWAGHVLESWRDAVVGFSYFKAPKA